MDAFRLVISLLKCKVLLRMLLLVGLLGPGISKAQLFVGMGLQAGYTRIPNANVPIDRYNDRAFLYKRMNRFHFPFGEIYAVSYRPDRLLLDLNLNTRRMRATAKSTDANGIYQRDVRFSIQSLSMGLGYAFVDEEKFVLYLGAAIDIGYMRLLTRTGYTSQIGRTDYYLWRRSPLLGGTAFAKMVFRANRETMMVSSLTPYIQMPFQRFDFIYLDQLLNQGVLLPSTGPLPGRAWSVGLAFNVDLDLLSFLMD